MLKVIKGTISWFEQREKKRRDVNELMSLSDKALNDIGINRCDIHRVVSAGRM